MASASSDPDNIIADAKIEYELKSLVVMGQCYDVVDSRPPNGLQIQLEGTASDTLVMQNLGYFQLRANPGIWYLHMGGSKYELSADVSVRTTCLFFAKPSSSFVTCRPCAPGRVWRAVRLQLWHR